VLAKQKKIETTKNEIEVDKLFNNENDELIPKIHNK